MVCNNYLKHLRGSIQYKHTRTVYDPRYAWPRFALFRFQLKDRFVAIRFKQTTDSYLIRFLILAAFRFLGAPVDSIRFDSKRFCFFRFRTGSIPYVQRFRFLNRFGTILYIYRYKPTTNITGASPCIITLRIRLTQIWRWGTWRWSSTGQEARPGAWGPLSGWQDLPVGGWWKPLEDDRYDQSSSAPQDMITVYYCNLEFTQQHIVVLI